MIEEKHLFRIYVKYQCKRKLFFRERFSTQWKNVKKVVYCFESDIVDKYKDSNEMITDTVTDWEWKDWNVISRELKYKNVEKDYTFHELSSSLCSE
jgi:hypothetical protein